MTVSTAWNCPESKRRTMVGDGSPTKASVSGNFQVTMEVVKVLRALTYLCSLSSHDKHHGQSSLHQSGLQIAAASTIVDSNNYQTFGREARGALIYEKFLNFG